MRSGCLMVVPFPGKCFSVLRFSLLFVVVSGRVVSFRLFVFALFFGRSGEKKEA